jgi:hypothetical protein
MKAHENKEKTENRELRSFAEFRKRFYPKPVEPETPELPDPEDVADKLAKESLGRLQAALEAK